MMKKKIRIMLIEDSPEYREVIDFALKDDLEIKLESKFSTAEIALRTLQNLAPRTTPDLILLDLNLPRKDGREFLEDMKGDENLRQIPVIVLTAKDLTDEDRRILNGRVEQIVEKGASNHDQVVKLIRQVVDQHT